MTQYRFTSAALFELKESALYYEQKENGLGIIFLDEIDATVRTNPAFSAFLAPDVSTDQTLPHSSLRIRPALSSAIK